MKTLERFQVVGSRLGEIGWMPRLGRCKSGRECSLRPPGPFEIPRGLEVRERISRTSSERTYFGNRFSKPPLTFFNLSYTTPNMMHNSTHACVIQLSKTLSMGDDTGHDGCSTSRCSSAVRLFFFFFITLVPRDE